MKKYWPVICLAVLSVVGLSIYYIHNVTASNTVRPFAFETIEGDEAQLDNIEFETNYYDKNDDLVETKQEPFHVNCVQYLTFLSSVQTLPQLFTAFIHQYIQDEQALDPLIFTKL